MWGCVLQSLLAIDDSLSYLGLERVPIWSLFFFLLPFWFFVFFLDSGHCVGNLAIASPALIDEGTDLVRQQSNCYCIQFFSGKVF